VASHSQQSGVITYIGSAYLEFGDDPLNCGCLGANPLNFECFGLTPSGESSTAKRSDRLHWQRLPGALEMTP